MKMQHKRRLTVEIQQMSGAQLIRFDRRVDSVNARTLESQLEASLDVHTPTVVSLETTEYVASAALRLILTTGKKLALVGFALACPDGTYVHEILVTAGFTSLFRVYPDETTALQAISR
jgi:anti-anti-sigma factor